MRGTACSRKKAERGGKGLPAPKDERTSRGEARKHAPRSKRAPASTVGLVSFVHRAKTWISCFAPDCSNWVCGHEVRQRGFLAGIPRTHHLSEGLGLTFGVRLSQRLGCRYQTIHRSQVRFQVVGIRPAQAQWSAPASSSPRPRHETHPFEIRGDSRSTKSWCPNRPSIERSVASRSSGKLQVSSQPPQTTRSLHALFEIRVRRPVCLWIGTRDFSRRASLSSKSESTVVI